MTKRQIVTAAFCILAISFLGAIPAFAHGDKVFPHVVDGIQPDGSIGYRTKFDISNVSYHLNAVVNKSTVYFYKPDGSPWTVAIKDPNDANNILHVSSYNLNLGFSQTIRLETLGTAAYSDGYAVIRDLEPTTDVPDDGEIAVTTYYEVLARNSQGGYDIIDTVSLPTSQPTVSWSFPVEIDTTTNLLSGYAIVDLSGQTNNIQIDLYQNQSSFSDQAVGSPASLSLNLGGNSKTVGFLNLADFFPTSTPVKFKGMAQAFSTSGLPLAFMALLQTPTKTGVQFATLVPTYLDSLRRNTFMYLPQGFSLDADLMISDYFRDETAAPDAYYEMPWDLLYQSVFDPITGYATNARYLVPQNGAQVSSLGVMDLTTFDQISLSTLATLTYTQNPIDLSDASVQHPQSQLNPGFVFAIKTGLGRYAKVMIYYYYTPYAYPYDYYTDLWLQIYVYR